MEVGRIDAFPRADIADVLGAELNPLRAQRLEGPPIHVGDVAIADAQALILRSKASASSASCHPFSCKGTSLFASARTCLRST